MALTRAEIVRAATRLAGEKGADALTMRGVAREMGVSPMALYNHVEDRADLVTAISDSFAEYILQASNLRENADRLFEAYRRWPYMVDLFRQSDDVRRVELLENMLDELGLTGAARRRAAQDWVAIDALAQGLVDHERRGGTEDIAEIFERFASVLS